MSLASIVVSIFVGLGLTTFSLRAHDNIQGVQIADLWNPGPFWRFLGAHILTVSPSPSALCCSSCPASSSRWASPSCHISSSNAASAPSSAMKESWRITKGHKWQLVLLFLALLGINLLGILALVVGIFVTVPITMLAFAHAYRTLAT